VQGKERERGKEEGGRSASAGKIGNGRVGGVTKREKRRRRGGETGREAPWGSLSAT